MLLLCMANRDQRVSTRQAEEEENRSSDETHLSTQQQFIGRRIGKQLTLADCGLVESRPSALPWVVDKIKDARSDRQRTIVGLECRRDVEADLGERGLLEDRPRSARRTKLTFGQTYSQRNNTANCRN